MADIKRTDIIIEGNTATWEMKEEGDIQGTFTGIFRFRCFLTPMQKINASREYREILGTNLTHAQDHETYLAFALTQLKQRIISSPPFWTSSNQITGMPGDLPDENLITAVLNAAIEAETKYKTGIKEKKLEAIDKAKKALEKMLSKKDEEASDESETEENVD